MLKDFFDIQLPMYASVTFSFHKLCFSVAIYFCAHFFSFTLQVDGCEDGKNVYCPTKLMSRIYKEALQVLLKYAKCLIKT